MYPDDSGTDENVFGGSFVTGGGEGSRLLYAVLVILAIGVAYYVWTKKKADKKAHGTHGIHGGKHVSKGGPVY